jgi:hypothetical protein
MRTLSICIGFVAVFVSYSSLGAQCVAYQGYSASSSGSVGIQTGSGWTENGKSAPPISAAINVWASGCAGMAGVDFPALVAEGQGDITVSVEYIAGHAPMSDEPYACSQFNHQLSGSEVIGGTIEVYAYSNNGTDCLYVQPHSVLDNLIAHEIGHVLGLANTACSGYIMGPDWPTDGVDDDECGWVDEFWTTSTEELQASCDVSCPVPCSGFPPVCDTGTSGGGNGEGGYGCGTSCSPLILDLDGDGILTTSLHAGVDFDISGDGKLDRTAWTVPGTEDAILYFDENRNRVIDGGLELFGDAAILPDGRRASHGFEALAALDENSDGLISPADTVWGRLRLWIDRNHDGEMTIEESYALSEQGVFTLDLSYVVMTREQNFGLDPSGNRHLLQGRFEQRVQGDVVSRPMHDVFFQVHLRP